MHEAALLHPVLLTAVVGAAAGFLGGLMCITAAAGTYLWFANRHR